MEPLVGQVVGEPSVDESSTTLGDPSFLLLLGRHYSNIILDHTDMDDHIAQIDDAYLLSRAKELGGTCDVIDHLRTAHANFLLLMKARGHVFSAASERKGHNSTPDRLLKEIDREMERLTKFMTMRETPSKKRIKPISPKEASSLKRERIPDYVIEAFNEMIAKKATSGTVSFKQKDVVDLILKKAPEGTTSSFLFENHFLDVEPIFIDAGWRVEYDKPGYNESYEPTFTFRTK